MNEVNYSKLSQKDILRVIVLSNWSLLLISSLIALFLHNKTGAGLFMGALIITLNFHFSYKNLKKSFTPSNAKKISFGVVFSKHYLRFLITCFSIFIIVASRTINPIGLLIGLSIIVLSLFIATIYSIIMGDKIKINLNGAN